MNNHIQTENTTSTSVSESPMTEDLMDSASANFAQISICSLKNCKRKQKPLDSKRPSRPLRPLERPYLSRLRPPPNWLGTRPQAASKQGLNQLQSHQPSSVEER